MTWFARLEIASSLAAMTLPRGAATSRLPAGTADASRQLKCEALMQRYKHQRLWRKVLPQPTIRELPHPFVGEGDR